jgi:hypothetical protein
MCSPDRSRLALDRTSVQHIRPKIEISFALQRRFSPLANGTDPSLAVARAPQFGVRVTETTVAAAAANRLWHYVHDNSPNLTHQFVEHLAQALIEV